ncbi:MAG TPA: phospholipase D family protein [Syntrophomonadaceae bacterium]|nr:phospholipase D family protein [Syntrophomonadaceae bacterium]
MNIGRIKAIFVTGFKSYLIYIFIFAIVIFAIQVPREKENIEEFSNDNFGLEKTKQDRVALIESGENAVLVRLNLIENAQKSLDISYHSLIEGKSTEILLGSILDAADRGVGVRVLSDGVFHGFTGNLKEALYGLGSHPNIKMRLYEPLKLLLPWNWNNRLHDKIIIADEKLALIGGRNIGDKYFREDVMQDRFVKDRDVIIYKDESLEDPASVIEDMENYYNRIWNHRYTKPAIKKLTSKQKTKGEVFNDNLRHRYMEIKAEHLQDNTETDWYKKTMATESVKFVYNPIGRVNQDPWCLRQLLFLSSRAEESIFIQSPYIIPSRNMKAKFGQYDLDLEKITMLTNSVSSSPNPMGIAGYFNNKKDIIDNGVKLYEYQGPDSIHSKTYIFDDTISVIGSFNLDARSSYINSESMVVISSKEFTRNLKEEIQVELNNSLIVDKDYSYIENEDVEEGHVSTPKKIMIFFLSKLAWFLDYLL